MERKIVLLPLLAYLFVSCAQNGFQAPLASLKDEKPTTTYSPPEPQARIIKTENRTEGGVVVVKEFKVVDGLSTPSDFTFDLDSKTSEAKLKGLITIRVVGSSPLKVPLEVSGKIDPETLSGTMPASNQEQLTALGVQSGASVTCLNESCTESFIDVYVKYQGYVYHHQLEVRGKNIAKDSDENPPTPKTQPKDSGKDPVKDHQPMSPKTPAPKKPTAPLGQTSGEDDGSQFEHDIDDEAEAGTYVGDPQKDITILFPDTTPTKQTPVTPAAPAGKNDPSGKIDNKKTPPVSPGSSSGKADGSKDDSKSDGKTETGPMDTVKAVLRGLGQAVTAVGRNNYTIGHLENPANVYEYEQTHKDAGFQILYPKRETYYSTDDMRNVLVSLGQYNNKYMHGYVTSVGDISRKGGGQLGAHSSHQLGLDADISFYFDDQSKQKGLVDAVASSKPIRAFMAEEQWALFKSLVEQKNVDRIFIHGALKKELCNVATRSGDLKAGDSDNVAFETLRVLRPEPSHDNHFHLRLKCSTAQPRCRQMAPPAKATGC